MGLRYVNNARIARNAEGEVSVISDFHRTGRLLNKPPVRIYHSITRLSGPIIAVNGHVFLKNMSEVLPLWKSSREENVRD